MIPTLFVSYSSGYYWLADAARECLWFHTAQELQDYLEKFHPSTVVEWEVRRP